MVYFDIFVLDVPKVLCAGIKLFFFFIEAFAIKSWEKSRIFRYGLPEDLLSKGQKTTRGGLQVWRVNKIKNVECTLLTSFLLVEEACTLWKMANMLTSIFYCMQNCSKKYSLKKRNYFIRSASLLETYDELGKYLNLRNILKSTSTRRMLHKLWITLSPSVSCNSTTD